MTILVDPDTLTTAYSAMTTSSDGDFDDTIANACITATSLSTTLSSASPQRTYAEEANRYVDSLSVEELYTLEQMLTSKEEELTTENINSKVYKKV